MIISNNSEILDEIIPVSVVMSVYDGIELDHLNIAVNSILNQTFNRFEFIIVLDGVKRNDIRLFLESLKISDKRVRLICIPENKGLANAMNKAIKSAMGEFIVRMDADDISHCNRIEKLVENMRLNNNLDILGSFIEEFSEPNLSEVKKIVKYPIKHEDMKNYFVKRNPLAHASVIFRMRFFDKAGFYPLFSIKNEDTLLWLSGFTNGCKFANLPDVLYSVRFTKRMGSRRIGLRKSFSDFVDRLRVIIDLKASSINVFYAIGMFIVQSLPYPIYSYIRSNLIHSHKID